jgi:hypothetical protein
VKGYSHELDEFIESVSIKKKEQRAEIVVYGTWLRAILQLENRLPSISDETTGFYAELHSYPIMLSSLEQQIAFIQKNAERGEPKAFVLSIWVHTLRSILRPELQNLAIKMWDLLMEGKPFWSTYLKNQKDEDLQIGIEQNFVVQTERLSRAILEKLPPKQLYNKTPTL